MYKSMKTLITNRYYKEGEDAQQKLDVFYMVNRLKDGEYTELTALVKAGKLKDYDGWVQMNNLSLNGVYGGDSG